ncbi:MAG: SDR family NAD(P)-dependent oxidoreductase [Steroidobacteraceae bacterium]|jgi:NAD(P)-dependent dehydrogenase (short-subunit alcohol dehydrogenase family)
MSRVFISGSSDGLGLMAARLLVAEGHEVTLHARNAIGAEDARRSVPQAKAVAVGDLSSIEEMRRVAEQVNALGRHDAVIHNAGVGYREARRIETVDGLSHVFAINVLAPYLLTALITPPGRLVYLSSGMHMGGDPSLHDPQWAARRWNGAQAYSDSKLFDVVLAFAVARAKIDYWLISQRSRGGTRAAEQIPLWGWLVAEGPAESIWASGLASRHRYLLPAAPSVASTS